MQRVYFFLLVFAVQMGWTVKNSSARKSSKKYVVRKGDNLTKISNRYSVSISELQRINRMRSRDRILVGQTIIIPSFRQKQRHSRQYRRLSNMPKFKSPVGRKRLLKPFDARGQTRTPGVLWRLRGSNEVNSSGSGHVIKIGYLRGYGKYVMLDHGNGWLSLYSNLSKILTQKGKWVRSGRRIGISKNKKLFFSISYKGKPLNPIMLLRKNRSILNAS